MGVGSTYVHLGKENIDTNYTYKLLEDLQYGAPADIFFDDLNGDKFDEILFVRPAYPVYENPLGKIYIYSYNKVSDAKDNKVNFLNNFELNQNYPNPFNPATSIRFLLSSRQIVTLKVFDILGKEITTLVDEEKYAGEYEIEFNASTYKLSSGVYFCELKMKGGNSSRIKMVLIK